MSKNLILNLPTGHKIELSEADFTNAKKAFFDPATVEGKAIEMAMTVPDNAKYATNAQEYFREAMIGVEKTRSKFRQMLGVKDRKKLGTVDMSAVVVKAGTCAFAPNDTALAQRTYEVKHLMLGTEFCIDSLEESFVSDQLTRGTSNFNQNFAFMNFFFETLGKWLDAQLENITFKGVLATNGVDGLEVKFADDTAVLKPTSGNGGVAGAVTTTNVIAKFKQARNVVPVAIRDREDFVYIVSTNVYDALADVVAENKASGLYFMEGERLTFQGVEIYKARGASNNVIIATYWENLVNTQDLVSDENGFNIVDFMKTTLTRKIGVRVDFRFEPNYTIPAEIYFHKPA